MAWWHRSALHIGAGEIIETTSPAQVYLITAHIAAGRNDLAALVAMMQPELFTAWDAAMMVAFAMGKAEAERVSKSDENADTISQGAVS